MADVNFSVDLVSSTSEKFNHRVRKFGFGDGYEQIAEDGINSRITEYSISTRPLNTVDAAAVAAVLQAAAKGDYLVMTLEPFSSTERRYRLADNGYSRKFLRGPSDGSTSTVLASYEVFEFTLVEAYSN
jgi:hypothetical protein